MNIFSKQVSIFNKIKTVIDGAASLTAFTKFYQVSVDAGDYLPALCFYIKSDQPNSTEEQSSLGNHGRSFTVVCRIMLSSSNTETLEEAADIVYSILFDSEILAFDLNLQMVGNPTLTYLFEETDNCKAADLDIPIMYKV